MKSIHYCEECKGQITEGVHEFSILVYGHSLCVGHQAFLTDSGATPQAVDLYFELKKRHIPVALEYYDGHKHIDIALPGKLHIEVNNRLHSDTVQAMKDLKNSVNALKENISTIHVPDYLLDDPRSFHVAVDELAKVCLSLLKRSTSYELASTLTSAQLQ